MARIARALGRELSSSPEFPTTPVEPVGPSFPVLFGYCGVGRVFRGTDGRLWEHHEFLERTDDGCRLILRWFRRGPADGEA